MPPSPGTRAAVPSTGHVDLRAPPPASPSRRPASPGRSSSQGQRSSSMAQRTTSTPGFQDIRQNSHLRVEVEDSVPFVVGAGPSVLARKHVPGGPVTSNPPAEQRLRVPSSTSSKQRSPSPGKKKAGSPHHAGSPHRRRRSPIPIPTKLKSAAGSPSAHAHGLSSPTKLVGSGSPARLERHLGSSIDATHQQHGTSTTRGEDAPGNPDAYISKMAAQNAKAAAAWRRRKAGVA